MLGFYVLAQTEWRTDETEGTWVTMPWWMVYSGLILALASILVSWVRLDLALLLWVLLPLGNLFVVRWLSPKSSHIKNWGSSG